MEKIYVIVGCMSGEDYSIDDPIVFEVCSHLGQARIDLENIVSDYKDDFSDNCDYDYTNNETEFEWTDYDHDEHGIIKIVEMELK